MPISGSARLIASAAVEKRPSANSACASLRSRPRDGGSERASAAASSNFRSRRSSSTRAYVGRRGGRVADGRPIVGGRARRVLLREAGVDVGGPRRRQAREEIPRLVGAALRGEAAGPPVGQPARPRDVGVERRQRLEPRARSRVVAGEIRLPGGEPQRLEPVGRAGSVLRQRARLGEGPHRSRRRRPRDGADAPARRGARRPAARARRDPRARAPRARGRRRARVPSTGPSTRATTRSQRSRRASAEATVPSSGTRAAVASASFGFFRASCPLRQRQQVARSLALRPRRGTVLRQQTHAPPRIARGHQRRSPPAALRRSQAALGFGALGANERGQPPVGVGGRRLEQHRAGGLAHDPAVAQGQTDAHPRDGHLGGLGRRGGRVGREGRGPRRRRGRRRPAREGARGPSRRGRGTRTAPRPGRRAARRRSPRRGGPTAPGLRPGRSSR